MRIGLFQSSLPCAGRKPGGVDVVVHRLAQQLVQRGHYVRVHSLTPAPGDALYEHRRYLWPSPNELQRILLAPLVLNWLDSADLDVLHLHGDDWFYFRRRLPTVRTFHGSALLEALHSARWRRRLSQMIVFGLELVSARLATDSYSVGPSWPKAYALSGELPPGVTVPVQPGGPKSTHPSVLFVGTWEGRKRGRFLFERFLSEVLPTVPEAELWMVADHCDPAPGVRLFRGVSDEILASLYRRAWVFCLPSTYEGFGIPYIEALASGTTVLATPNVGSCHLLGTGCGWLVGDGELGQALCRLLSDERLRDGLRRAGEERAQEFSWQRVIDAHEHAYERAIGAWEEAYA